MVCSALPLAGLPRAGLGCSTCWAPERQSSGSGKRESAFSQQEGRWAGLHGQKSLPLVGLLYKGGLRWQERCGQAVQYRGRLLRSLQERPLCRNGAKLCFHKNGIKLAIFLVGVFFCQGSQASLGCTVLVYSHSNTCPNHLQGLWEQIAQPPWEFWIQSTLGRAWPQHF